VRGAKAVGVEADVSGVFSEPVRRASLTRGTVKLVRKGTRTAVPARLGYDAGRRRVTIDPTSALRRHTTYRVVLSTWVRDLAGNRLTRTPYAGPSAGLVDLHDPVIRDGGSAGLWRNMATPTTMTTSPR
jgi:hypothetical protein